MNPVLQDDIPLGYASFTKVYEAAKKMAIKASKQKSEVIQLKTLLRSCGKSCRDEILRRLQVEGLQLRYEL